MIFPWTFNAKTAVLTLLFGYLHANAFEAGGQLDLTGQAAVFRPAPSIFKHIQLIAMRIVETLEPRCEDPAMAGTTSTTSATLGLYAGDTVVQRDIHQGIARTTGKCLG